MQCSTTSSLKDGTEAALNFTWRLFQCSTTLFEFNCRLIGTHVFFFNLAIRILINVKILINVIWQGLYYEVSKRVAGLRFAKVGPTVSQNSAEFRLTYNILERAF